MNEKLEKLNAYIKSVHEKGELTDCAEAETYRTLANEALASATDATDVRKLEKILYELDNIHDVCALEQNHLNENEEDGDGFGLGV